MRDLTEKLAAWFPEATRNGLDLESFARDGLVEAAGYGLTGARDIARFVAIRVAVGPGFDRRWPWAKAILTEPRLTPGAKMRALMQAALGADPDELR